MLVSPTTRPTFVFAVPFLEDERARHFADKHNAHAFIKRRFGEFLRERGIKYVIEVTRDAMNNWRGPLHKKKKRFRVYKEAPGFLSR